MTQVVVIDDGYADYETERRIVGAAGASLVLRPCRGEEDRVREAIRDAAAVLVRESPVSAAAIEAASGLRGIVRYGIGVDNIDCGAAAARRIYVANVPNYGTEDVADHAMALLLAVVRRVVSRDAYVRAGGWFSGTQEKKFRLAGKTLGLVGYGRIAQAFERRMRGFGIGRVLVVDPDRTPVPGVEHVSIEFLCREADYISLHAPLTTASHHILDAARLALCKPTAIVVNTSRGGLIDEAALIAALAEGRLFGAGLDVFEQEPPAATNPLLQMTNVVLSDHAGWYSEESVADLQRKAAEEVARILGGQPPQNWVNRWNEAG